MCEPADAVLPYSGIIRLRERLRSGEVLSSAERELFAGSIVSHGDVALLKHLLVVGDPETAGDTALALFSRGGVGNLNTELRPWLEKRGDEDTRIDGTAPLVLGACVRQLDDGTALRQLFEFSYKYDVNVTLGQVLEDAEQLPLDRILRQSIPEQIDRLVECRGQEPSNRFLWTLRTYVHYESCRTYLSAVATAGRVAALVSCAVSGDILDWGYLAAAAPQDEFEIRLLVNVALDNLARGANQQGKFGEFVSHLREQAKNEFLDGLSLL